ncbi:hypothetical protein FRB99_005796 [Tulasnella sp. 403]|nr:hypothetical protein FRB99_005796 [Tulasnella sp. 403]
MVQTIEPGLYRLKNVMSSTYLDMSTRDDKEVFACANRPFRSKQKWWLEHGQNGYHLKNYGNGRYAYVGSPEHGTRLRASNVPAEWDIEATGDVDTYCICVAGTRSAMDLHLGSDDDGTPISLWGFVNAGQQLWCFERQRTTTASASFTYDFDLDALGKRRFESHIEIFERPLALLGVLQELVQLAQAAQIPLCGGALTIASKLLSTCQRVSDNQAAYEQLASVLGRYAKTLTDFISVLEPGYLSNSPDRHAAVARDAIATFNADLLSVDTMVERNAKRRWWKRWFRGSRIAEEITQCTQHLNDSHTAFHDAVSNVIAGGITHVLRYNHDDFGITGTKPLAPDAVGPMVPIRFRSHEKPLKNLVQTVVEGKTRAVKLYCGPSGEERFLRDMRFLQRNAGPYFQVFGYSRRARPPYMVLHSARLTGFRTFLASKARYVYSSIDANTIAVWKMLLDMTSAVDFILENNPDITGTCMMNLIINPMVDERNQLVLALPGWVDEDASWKISSGASQVVAKIWHPRLLRVLPSFGQLVFSKPRTILNTDEHVDSDLAGALARLNSWNVPCRQRPLHVPWRGASLGDVGILDWDESDRQAQPEFKKVERLVLPLTWDVAVERGSAYLSQVSTGIFRLALPASFGEEVRSELLHIDFEWASSLEKTDDAWLLVAQEAQRLAALHGVPPENFIFTVDEVGYLSVNVPRVSTWPSGENPLSLFIHLDETPVRAYWTFSTQPLDEVTANLQKPDMVSRGCQEPVFSRIAWRKCIQLNQDDITQLINDYRPRAAVAPWGLKVNGGGG